MTPNQVHAMIWWDERQRCDQHRLNIMAIANGRLGEVLSVSDRVVQLLDSVTCPWNTEGKKVRSGHDAAADERQLSGIRF